VRWFGDGVRRVKAQLRLLCFPHAGGNETVFRDWQDAMPTGVQVRALALPDRLGRVAAAPLAGMDDLLDALVEATIPLLDRPCAFYGHSLGGLVAFELARRLRRRGLPAPVHLFVGAVVAPRNLAAHRKVREATERLARLDLEGLGGTPAAVLADREFAALAEPAVRADAKVIASYAYRSEKALDLPITTFGGTTDSWISPEDLAGWERETSGPFTRHTLPGGHFFLQEPDASTLLMQKVRGALASYLDDAFPEEITSVRKMPVAQRVDLGSDEDPNDGRLTG
jgi:surfactin synthase thioesterase subunit